MRNVLVAVGCFGLGWLAAVVARDRLSVDADVLLEDLYRHERWPNGADTQERPGDVGTEASERVATP